MGREAREVELRLFVAGDRGPSARARRELEGLRVEFDGIDWRVEVIDVLERTDLAEAMGIVATPVLIRVVPAPRRGIIGDLSDWQTVAEVLELGPGRGRQPGTPDEIAGG